MAIVKNTNDLIAQAQGTQEDNTTQNISPQDVREMSENLAVSNYNRLTDAPLVGLKDYNTLVQYESGQGAISGGKIYISNKVTGPGAFVPADWDLYDNLSASDKAKLDFITVTASTDLDDIRTKVAGLDQAVVIRGTWDPSSGVFPGGGTAQAGDCYLVTGTNGTVDGVDFTVDQDRIIAITDNASASVYAGNWYKEDGSDRVLSVNSQTGVVVLDKTDVGLSNVPNVDATQRSNHTGTQLASTISDFDTEVANNSAVTANTAKVTNATHSGDASGASALTLQPQAITGKTSATVDGADLVLVSDTDDTGALKKVTAQSIADLGGATGGLVGIPDASGIFTYSTDVKTAIEGASAGQTVFLFGDCETTTGINVPNGVNIQGNGFKIFNQQADATQVFFINDATGYIGKWSNLTLEKSNATGGPNCVYIYGGAVSGPTQIECSNVKVISDDPSQASFYLRNALAGNFIKGLTTIAPYGIQSDNGEVIECSAFSTTNYAIYAPNPASKVINCYGETVSGPVFGGNIFIGCTGVSVSGDVCVSGSHYNGTYFSTSGRVTTAPLYNCQGSTTSTNPASISILENSSIKNFGSGDGHRTFNFGLRILNSFIYSAGGIASGDTNTTSNAQYINCTIESGWNNAGGHAVRGGTGMKIIGCSLKVANSSANCITCTDGEFANNTYEGATTSVVGTQLITNLTDNQGNISI